MKKSFFWATLLPLFLFSCQSDLLMLEVSEPPTKSAEDCQFTRARLNYNDESYSINGGDFTVFDDKMTLWIPDVNSTPPVIYIVTREMEFCEYLDLNFEDYSYTLEAIANPDGWWYEIQITDQDMTDVLNGKTVNALFKRQNITISNHEPAYDNRTATCSTRHFQTGINDEIYAFNGGAWTAYDEAFEVKASFQPAQMRIYASNVHLCEELELNLDTYDYTLESEPEPHYLVTLPEEDLVPLVNGATLSGNFAYRPKLEAVAYGPVFE